MALSFLLTVSGLYPPLLSCPLSLLLCPLEDLFVPYPLVILFHRCPLAGAIALPLGPLHSGKHKFWALLCERRGPRNAVGRNCMHSSSPLCLPHYLVEAAHFTDDPWLCTGARGSLHPGTNRSIGLGEDCLWVNHPHIPSPCLSRHELLEAAASPLQTYACPLPSWDLGTLPQQHLHLAHSLAWIIPQ